jgi:hypothetical protein
VNHIDDDFTQPFDFFCAAILLDNPVQRLLGRRNIVSLGCKQEQWLFDIC